MTVREPHEPATIGDLTPLYIWIGTLAKVLVQEGIIERDKIIAEFQTIKSAGSTFALEDTVEAMINRVRGW